jgi:hypothetical protein
MRGQLRGVIPSRYQTLTGIDKYQFYVWDAFCYRRAGMLMRLHLHKPAKVGRFEFRRDHDPRMFDLLCLVDELRHRRPYRERYLNAYKCREILSQNIPEDYRAVRHSLSHPPMVLAKPSIVSILKRHFGSTQIDLSLHAHRKIFFVYLGNMLMENDTLLYEHLRKKWRI